MASAFRRLELWSNLQAAGGTALGAFPDVLRLVVNERIAGDETLEVTFPKSTPVYSLLLARRVLRVIREDGTWTEWRILGPWDEVNHPEQGTVVQLTAVGPLLDLAECGPTFRTEADGSVQYSFEGLGLTAAQHFTNLLTAALTLAGNTYTTLVTALTATKDVVYSFSSPLEVLRRLAELLNTELRYVPNGTSAYEARLETVGTAAPTLQVRWGKNLRAVKRTFRADQQGLHIVPAGAEEDGKAGTMAHAQWKVAGLSGSTLQLTDPAGGDNALAFDDQLNGYYLRKPDGSFTQITDGVQSTQLITVASAAGLANGDLVQVRLLNTPAAPNGDGTHLTYLQNPAAKAAYNFTARVLPRPDIPDTLNMVPNAGLASWSAGLPVGFSLLGNALITEISTSNRHLSGGRSARVQTVDEGDGMESDWIAILPTTNNPAFSALWNFWLDGKQGRCRVDLLLGKATVSLHATPGTAITRTTASGITTVTVTTASAHGLSTNDTVELAGVVPTGYRGLFSVTVLSTTTFSFIMYTDPGICTTTGTVRWVRQWPDGVVALAFTEVTNAWETLAVAGIDAKVPAATVAKLRFRQDGMGFSTTVTIVNAGTTATVTHTAHGYSTGARVRIAGASHAANNGIFTITVTGTNTYTYTMGSSPGSSPTGTITATFGSDAYVDSFQLTQTASSRPFLIGSGGTQLWQAANRALLVASTPGVRYVVDLLDLERLDAVRWPSDAIVLGQTVHVVDDELGADPTTRVLELTTDLLTSTFTQLTLSDRPDDLTDTILGRLPPARQAPSLGADFAMAVQAAFTNDLTDVTKVTVQLTSAPSGATVYYWLGSVGEQPPRIGSVLASGAPTTTQWAPYVAPVILTRGQTQDLQVHAYCTASNRFSPIGAWTLAATNSPTVAGSISQVLGGMRVSWVPNGNVGWVDVYSRRTASGGGTQWPTTSGAQSAALSTTYFRGRYHVSTNGLAWSATGNIIAAALLYTDSTAYPWANGDAFAVILVPVDRNLNPGTREELSSTYVTTPAVAISTFTVSRTADGTACGEGTGAEFTLAWTEGVTAWVNATHDLLLYLSTDGGANWGLLTTITTPHTTTSYVYVSPWKKTSGKFDGTMSLLFRADLSDGGVLDSASTPPEALITNCAFA